MKLSNPVRLPARSKPVKEREIQREIIEFLRQTGRFVLRLNSGKVRVRGGWMQLCPEGTPDVQVIERVVYPAHGSGFIIVSRVTWIETKTAKGIHSDSQIQFRKDAEYRGERYILARSLGDVIQALKYGTEAEVGKRGLRGESLGS